jgi:rod shape-determining protein MreC
MDALNIFHQISVFLKIVRKSAIYIIIPVFFIYILIDKPDYTIINALHRPVVSIAAPVGQAVTWPVRAVKNMAADMVELGSVAEDNAALRKALDEKMEMENEYTFLKSENERLKGLLKIQAESKFGIVWGEIISNNKSLSNTFAINVGTAQGVKEGEIVLSHRGNLLGFVESALGEYSKVRTLSDANSSIIVKVGGTEVFGFLQGNNTGNPYFEYYSDPDFAPMVGMQIVSSGMNSLMPANIPIGEITKVYSKTRAGVGLYDLPGNVRTIRVLEYDFKEKYKGIAD